MLRWAVALCLLFLGQGGLMAAPMTQGEYDRLAGRLQAENEEIARQMTRNQMEIDRLNAAIAPLNEQVSSSLFLGPGNLGGGGELSNLANRALGLGKQSSNDGAKQDEIYRQIDALEKQRNPLLAENETLRARAESNDRQLAEAGEALERAKQEQAAETARLAREAEDKRVADAKAAEEARLRKEAEKAAAAQAAEERRIAREQAQEQRKWTLLYLVGGVTTLLFGVFIALRAFGVSASLSEWGKFYFWLVKAAVAVSFALFLLTAVETFFGALTVPDWMRRPLAELLNKASDAIDPEAKEAVK